MEKKKLPILKQFYKIYEWHISKNLDFENMPKHIAIMMDGNRRYAKTQTNMLPIDGHKHGKDTLDHFLEWCIDFEIEIVTIYAFSVNNFNRSSSEVEGLMDLFIENFEIISKNKRIHDNHVRIKAVGKLELLPDDVIEAIKDAEKSTASYDNMILNIAIGYDGRLEIIDSLKNISKSVKNGKLNLEDIDEKFINKNLYTAGLDDPNLMIRTSGEERLSGFLLWQSSYSELYFCDSYWPNFRKIDFLRALRSYQKRTRRFGV